MTIPRQTITPGEQLTERVCAVDGCEATFVPRQWDQRACGPAHRQQLWLQTRTAPSVGDAKS